MKSTSGASKDIEAQKEPFVESSVKSSLQQKKNTPSSNRFSFLVNSLFDPKFRGVRDLYTIMFLLDLVCVIIIVSTYSSITSGGSGDFTKDIQTNRVPWPFVLLLFFLFVVLVIDRGLYLCKSTVCKMIFDGFMFALLHGVVFIYPLFKGDFRTSLLPLYAFKCAYFVVSAIQLFKGYPSLSMENFTKVSYGIFSLILSKMFIVVPFLFELRTAIDWTWTKTSLSFVDFYNFENFYIIIFGLKCKRTWERNYPDEKGKMQSKWIKYGCGIPMILIVIIVILCPLVVFSVLNSIGDAEPLECVRFSLAIEGYPPFYIMRAEGNAINTLEFGDSTNAMMWYNRLSDNKWEDSADGADPVVKDRRQLREKSRQAKMFVEDYFKKGVVRIKFRPQSEQAWQISNEDLASLKYDLMEEKKEMKLKIKLEFKRDRLDPMKESSIRSNTFIVSMERNSTLRNSFVSVMEKYSKAIASSEDPKSAKVIIPYVVPMFVVVPNQGKVFEAAALLNAANFRDEHETAKLYNGLILTFTKDGSNFYWTANMIINEGILRRKLGFEPEKMEYGRKDMHFFEIVSFMDKTFPFFIPAYFVGGGIVAMYVVLVVSFGQLVRRLIFYTPLDVLITEMKNPDRLLHLCQNMYVAREVCDFKREQALYATLIAIFRNNAMLIDMTKEEEEDNNLMTEKELTENL